jgi:hypothetical protein
VISALMQSVTREWEARAQKPFIRLVRLFTGRIFHGSGESDEGELGASMGVVLSLLPLLGGFYSIFLFDKYGTFFQWLRGAGGMDLLTAALPDEYFFIVFSMVVTGVVAVWRWDSIFPDRRDYANLVSLPIATRNIFLANLAAILFVTLVLALDVNAASVLLFPLVVSASQNTFTFFVHFVWVHAFTVLLASIFSFFAVFGTVGILMVTLPYAMFRRVSLYLRGAIIAGLIALLSTSFAVPSMVNQVPESMVRFLPPVWFLGLCQSIRGRATPPLALLGRVALIGSGTIILAAVVIYILSYRRCFIRIPETADIIPITNRAHFSWLFRALDRTILATPFQRAGYRFIMKTLLRSEHHGLVLGGFFGLGIVTASEFLLASFNGKNFAAGSLPSPAVLAIPLILSYCNILGVRFVFEIPIDLRGNWIFQISLDKARHECAPLARKVIMTFVLPWMLLIALPLYGYLWGWRAGLLQMLVVIVWSLLLAEILLLRFRKLPFTCSYPPFRDSAIVLVLAYVLGFFVFVILTSNLEHWALLNPLLMAWFVAIALVAWYVLSRLKQEAVEIDKELIFEENATAGFELLDLRHGS